MRDVQCAHPHGHSSSHPQSWSLDRCLRSLSRHQQERRVTFWEPEAEADPEEGPYRGALGHSCRILSEISGGVLLSTQRQETACPPGRPMACQDAKGRGNYPSQPSIKDVETWLDWWACQMDMPYWWAELTAIPGVEDPRKLTWKFHTSFSILAVRSKVFLGQGYTVPLPQVSHLECVSPGWPVLSGHVTAAFSLNCGLHPRITVLMKRLNPPADLDFCPLVRSVLGLKERVKEHVVFSK